MKTTFCICLFFLLLLPFVFSIDVDPVGSRFLDDEDVSPLLLSRIQRTRYPYRVNQERAFPQAAPSSNQALDEVINEKIDLYERILGKPLNQTERQMAFLSEQTIAHMIGGLFRARPELLQDDPRDPNSTLMQMINTFLDIYQDYLGRNLSTLERSTAMLALYECHKLKVNLYKARPGLFQPGPANMFETSASFMPLIPNQGGESGTNQNDQAIAEMLQIYEEVLGRPLTEEERQRASDALKTLFEMIGTLLKAKPDLAEVSITHPERNSPALENAFAARIRLYEQLSGKKLSEKKKEMFLQAMRTSAHFGGKLWKRNPGLFPPIF